MRIVLYKCDICKQVISSRVYTMEVGSFLNSETEDGAKKQKPVTDEESLAKISKKHFCPDCIKVIADVINKPKADKLAEPKEEPKEPKPKKVRVIDKGKVMALYKRGWKLEDIAADVRFPEEDVKACIQEFYKAG